MQFVHFFIGISFESRYFAISNVIHLSLCGTLLCQMVPSELCVHNSSASQFFILDITCEENSHSIFAQLTVLVEHIYKLQLIISSSILSTSSVQSGRFQSNPSSKKIYLKTPNASMQSVHLARVEKF